MSQPPWRLLYIDLGTTDDLCRVATNFGYSTRTLHTTDEETTFELTRLQIITAIDALVTRDDLAEREARHQGGRVLMVQLPEITEKERLPQAELNARVEAAKPRILGALLTALSQTLAAIPNTKPDTLPRMADYALFAIASENALGLKDGDFMKVFNQSREQSRQVAIESSPVGEAILSLMRDRLVWKGTALELLNELEKCTDEATYRSRYFLRASNSLQRQLNRLAPDLKALGVDSIDKNTLFSKPLLENTKTIAALKIGDRVKPKDVYHVHGSDIGTVASFDDWAVSVTWDDKSNGKYSADELEAIS